MYIEKRRTIRVPVEIYMNQYIRDVPIRCFSTNISPEGIFINRLIDPIFRPTSIVALEFVLPEQDEVIWAKGEIIYDCLDPFFHGSGIHFVEMASFHKELLRKFVEKTRRRILSHMLTQVLRKQNNFKSADI